MTAVPENGEASGAGAGLEGTARSFVPRVRELARSMEAAGRLDEELVEAMEAAGLFSVVVPRRWGGGGLGPHELNAWWRSSALPIAPPPG